MFGVVHPQHYSDASILSATIDDPVFGGLWQTHRHVVPSRFNDSRMSEITQAERLAHIVQLLNVTVNVLHRANISVFLDAGVLLGHYRHHGRMIPWDNDGDVGIIADECRSKYPDDASLLAKLRAEIEAPYLVEYFDCRKSEFEDIFAGIIVDPRTGFKVDVFAFLTVNPSKDSFSWRKSGQWLQRDLDKTKYHHVMPRDAILPLRWGNFSGITGNIIPNDPKRTLQWDFGFVIDEPIFPFQLNRNVSMGPMTVILILLLIFMHNHDSMLVYSGLSALFVLGGGLRVLTLLLICLRFHGRTRLWKAFRTPIRRFLLWLTIGLLISELQPLFPVMFKHFMEAAGVSGFTVNEGRYCLLYKLICIDQ